MKNFKTAKLFLMMFLTISLIMINLTIVSAATVTMSEVTDKFNTCKTVESYKQYDYNYAAKVEGNKFVVEMNTPESSDAVEFDINGTVLNALFTQEDSFRGLVATMLITDCVGQLHGYEDGELFDTLNSEQIGNYTIDNEGFEIKAQDDGNYEVKIDINKKLPLADFSNTYITVEDLDDFVAGILSSDEGGSVSGSKGPLRYYVSVYGEDETTIYIGEKDGISDRTYNSLMSFFEVMFNSKDIASYFQSNYSGIAEGNKSFNGFTIEVNATNEDVDFLSSLEGFNVTKVVVDKNAVRTNILNEIVNNNTNTNTEFNTEAETSTENNINGVIIAIIAVVAILVVCLIVVLSRKEKQ